MFRLIAIDFSQKSPHFSLFSMVAILVGSQDHWTQIWKGPFEDHSTKVWLQLAQWSLRRRLKCEILTDGRRTKSDDKSPHFSLLSPTSPCELSEREVTSPSNLKVVGALDLSLFYAERKRGV
jgi:hypothetical protein